jgi:hypothetical protein
VVLESTTLESSSLETVFAPTEINIDNVNVTGSFEILIEYSGSGIISVTSVDVMGET